MFEERVCIRCQRELRELKELKEKATQIPNFAGVCKGTNEVFFLCADCCEELVADVMSAHLKARREILFYSTKKLKALLGS